LLWGALLLAPAVANSDGAEAASDGNVVRDNILIAVCLVLLVAGIGAAVVYFRHRQLKHELKEEAIDESLEVKEWLYQEGPNVVGPYSNSQMRTFWVAGIVKRTTQAKIVWWKQDFQPVSELFPQAGTEFAKPAKIDDEEARGGDWHRFSVLAQPVGPSAPTLYWYYKLANGNEEGPFESGKMRHWFSTGFFTEDLLVRYDGADTAEFKRLRDLFTDVSEAFNVLPNGCSPARARTTMQARISMQARTSMAARHSAVNFSSVKPQAKPQPQTLGSFVDECFATP